MCGTTRLILDTNVWLDWLVFADPSTAVLDAARRSGSVDLLTDAACCEEWQRVLTYPAIAGRLSPRVRERIDAEGPGSPRTRLSALSPVSAKLPRCKDPDDQKFIELAARVKADCLITRDKALLMLRPDRMGLSFRIMTLPAWNAATGSPAR